MALFCENCLEKIEQWVFGAKYFVQVQQENQATGNIQKPPLMLYFILLCQMGCQFFVQFNTNSQTNLSKYCMIHTQA